MLSIKIEKEIKQENKVLGGLTLRQLIFAVIGAGSCTAVYLVSNLPVDALYPAFISIAAVCGVFGWVKSKDGGLHAEDYILRFLKRVVYHNGRLLYRTANEYIGMYNSSRVKKAKTKSVKKLEKKNYKQRRKIYRTRPMKRYL